MSGQKPSGESVFSFLGNLLIAFGIMLVILVAGALGGGGGSGGRAGDAGFFMVVLALPVLLVVAIMAMIFKAIGAVTRKETSGEAASESPPQAPKGPRPGGFNRRHG